MKLSGIVRVVSALALAAAGLVALAGFSTAGAASLAPKGPVTLYVSTTGSDTSNTHPNTCATAAKPCASIQQAVTEAGTEGGEPVTIEIGQGTYATQVTVPGTWTTPPHR
jgi:hypothetical protein